MGIYDVIKDLLRLSQQIGNLELLEKLHSLSQSVTDLNSEKEALQNENQALKEELAIKGTLQFRNNAYWRIQDGKVDGPFCSRCWDCDKKLVRIIRQFTYNPHCPHCKVQISKEHFKYVPAAGLED